MAIPTKISGFTDYSEKEHRLFAFWKQKLEDIYRRYGFMGFYPRPVESTVALQKKGGISSQIYTVGRLNDNSMTEFALPFDRTVPFAVYVATHRHELVYPFKRFDISYSFRGERPQAGRFRGFIQADIDVITPNLSPLGEVDCLLAMAAGLKCLQIPPFTINVNHIDIPKMLMLEMGITESLLPEALRIVDKMDKIGFDSVKTELLTLFPTLDLSLLPLLTFRGTLTEFLLKAPLKIQTAPSLTSFKELFELLDPNIFSFNPGMVRGLDYYTGLVCETFLCNYPSYGSIASGGRYNQLIDSLIDEKTNLEGFGLSIGLTRLFDILKKERMLPQLLTPQAEIAVVYREESLQKSALDAAQALRDEGIATDVFFGSAPIGKQIAYADKKQIPYVFMLMGESYVIKDLAQGTQTEDIPQLSDAVQRAKKDLIQFRLTTHQL